jgi:nitroreductase
MTSIQEAIEQRRAVKHFDPAHKLSTTEWQELVRLAQQAPSSFNIQHWRLVHVTDTTQRAAIRAAAWDQAQITEASDLIVLCADVKAWEKNPAQYWQDAPDAVQNALVPMIGPFYAGRDQLQRDEAMRSVGLIAQTIMLAAKGLGYDSCPMIGFDTDQVAKLINLPGDHVIGMMIVIGKATKPAHPKGGYLPFDQVVITNKF